MTPCYIDTNMENVFYHKWDYLLQQAQAGIIINEKKFKFCWDNIEFAGIKSLTPQGLTYQVVM